PTRLLIVLGSGGHTAEMLSMLRKLDPERFLVDWAWRTYVVSEGDGFSAERAGEFEAGLVGRARRGGSGKGPRCYDIRVVPRARRIHQSLLTAPWSALQCLWSCFSVLSSPSLTRSTTSTTSTTLYPSLILTNGPGTAVIVLLASLLLRFFDVRGANSSGRMRSVYIESWARVKKLSLSGRLVVRVVDRFVVQWEGLVERTGGRGEFLGVLV
ncbi:glycosyltransferase family 1 protein, partial [Saccharata proteae CBS 121410]